MPSLYPFAPIDLPTSTPPDNSIYLLLIGKSEGTAPEVELRTSRLVCSGDGESTALPFISCTSKRAASRPFSTMGWRTVVSGGLVHDEAGTSSYPTTESSWGTRMPAAWAADMTPIAVISLIA